MEIGMAFAVYLDYAMTPGEIAEWAYDPFEPLRPRMKTYIYGSATSPSSVGERSFVSVGPMIYVQG